MGGWCVWVGVLGDSPGWVAGGPGQLIAVGRLVWVWGFAASLEGLQAPRELCCCLPLQPTVPPLPPSQPPPLPCPAALRAYGTLPQALGAAVGMVGIVAIIASESKRRWAGLDLRWWAG